MFKYRTSPLSNCDSSPAQLIFNYQPRNLLVSLQRTVTTSEPSHASKAYGKSESMPERYKSQSNPNYNSTCHPLTSHSWKRWTTKTLVKPKARDRDKVTKELKQRKMVEYKVGDEVYFFYNNEWIRAKIIERESFLVHKIKILASDVIRRAHAENLKIRKSERIIGLEEPQHEEGSTMKKREGLRKQPKVDYKKFY